MLIYLTQVTKRWKKYKTLKGTEFIQSLIKKEHKETSFKFQFCTQLLTNKIYLFDYFNLKLLNPGHA